MYKIGIIISSVIFLAVLVAFTWMMICYATEMAKHTYDKHVSKKIVHCHFGMFKLDVSPHAVPYVLGVFIIALAVIWLIDSLIILVAMNVM